MSGENETALTGAVEQVAPAETAPAVEGQEKAPESTTEQESEAQRERDEQGRFKAKKDAQDRINDLTRNWRQTERERDALAARIAQFEQAQPQRPEPTDKPPAFQDFQDLDQWAAAVAQHAAAQAERKAEQKFSERAQQSTQEQVFNQYAERERAYAAANPDYQDAYNALASSVRMSPQVLEVIAESDVGPAVVKHLGTHLDVADRISRLPDHKAAAEIARIEAQVKAPKAKPVSNAPPPAPVVGGASTVSKDPERMTTDEWVRWRNDQLKANR